MRNLVEYSREFYGVIYKISSSLFDEVYIGKTIDLNSRINSYKSNSYKNINDNDSLIMGKIKSVGFENIKFEIIDTAKTQEELNKKEKSHIIESAIKNNMLLLNSILPNKTKPCFNEKEFKKFYGVIYKIKFKTSNKIYIGKTIDFLRRVREYKKISKKVTSNSNYKLGNYIREVGFDNVEFEIIDYANNSIELNEKEIFWIKLLDSINPEKGFNIKTGGVGGKMKSDYFLRSSRPFLKEIHTAEVKRKKSKRIVAYKDNEFSIYDGAVLFALENDVDRTNVTSVIKGKGIRLKGSFIYYLDDIEEIKCVYDKRKNDLEILKESSEKYKLYKEYIDTFDIIKKGVEAIENNKYKIKYVYYE